MPGSIIVSYLGMTGITATITAFAINMVASAVIAKAFAPDVSDNNIGTIPNPGNRQQLPPATDNKLPVIYGSAFVGGTITDLSITTNNQTIYYVLSLAEVTNSENGNTGDIYTFGDVYWSGKKVIFSTVAGEGYKVTGLLDESTGLTDTSINGYLEIYLYRNGSSTPTNSSTSAITLLSDPSLTYQWNATKLMSNTAFAVVKILYSQDAGTTGIQQTRFQINSPRSAPGDCFLDYLTSERYGAAVPLANIDTASLNTLNTYSNGLVTYTPYTGGSSTITRFRFDGLIDTSQPIMSNIQLMANCCDCLVRYNEITAKWGIITQQPTYSPVMTIDNSNIVGAISVTPLDIANSYNIAEVKFVDSTEQDTFASAIFDLAVVNPSLMYPNEPVNKQQITLPLINNNVRAQLLANRFLESCREDLQVQCVIGYVGIQLEAGDIIEMTNANYGWSNKPFRVQKVTENFSDNGQVTASLVLAEFNSAVFDDANITQFTPSPNTGFFDPAIFGTVPAPTISGIVNSGFKPKFDVVPVTSSAGIIEYVELWYSTVSNPTASQLTLLQTYTSTNGTSYGLNFSLPAFEIADFVTGTYYFFTRMGNALKTSIFSPAASIVWNPVHIDNVATIGGNGINLEWSAVSNWRLAGYKLRYQYGSSTDWGSGIPLFDGVLTETSYLAYGLPSALVTVMVKAVDTVGNESLNAAYVQLNTTDTLLANVVEVIDFKADGWPGIITNATIVGGNLVATVDDSFYGLDDQSFYGLDSEPFYTLATVESLQYTTDPVFIISALSGSSGVLNWTALGNAINVEYRLVNDSPFYGADGDSKYGIDPNASFYGQDNPFIPMPSSIVMANDIYQFRITIGTGTVGEVSAFNFVIDAPDLVEVIPNHIVTGGAIPYTKNFTSIKAVQATLQQNALGVVTLRVDKTVPLAPTLTGYNSANAATSGAKADITLQGY
jgi:hypothetical protein